MKIKITKTPWILECSLKKIGLNTTKKYSKRIKEIKETFSFNGKSKLDSSVKRHSYKAIDVTTKRREIKKSMGRHSTLS